MGGTTPDAEAIADVVEESEQTVAAIAADEPATDVEAIEPSPAVHAEEAV